MFTYVLTLSLKSKLINTRNKTGGEEINAKKNDGADENTKTISDYKKDSNKDINLGAIVSSVTAERSKYPYDIDSDSDYMSELEEGDDEDFLDEKPSSLQTREALHTLFRFFESADSYSDDVQHLMYMRKRLCPSVSLSVRPSVRPSVGCSSVIFE